MEVCDLELGQVVRSIAGRDKGKFFVVIQKVDFNFVRISDGDLRKIDKSKLKKIKHLAKTNHIISQLNKRLTNCLKVSNADIRRYLEDYRKSALYENGGVEKDD
ncbi:MAG: hypothetical protein ACOWWR_11380 [Eubacteriales bacterium]